jgi:hypothetical protein
MEFLDVFSGDTIKVPNRTYISKIVKYVKIYQYLKNKECSPEALLNAKRLFKMREASLLRIYKKVEKLIGSKEASEVKSEGTVE